MLTSFNFLSDFVVTPIPLLICSQKTVASSWKNIVTSLFSFFWVLKSRLRTFLAIICTKMRWRRSCSWELVIKLFKRKHQQRFSNRLNINSVILVLSATNSSWTYCAELFRKLKINSQIKMTLTLTIFWPLQENGGRN